MFRENERYYIPKEELEARNADAVVESAQSFINAEHQRMLVLEVWSERGSISADVAETAQWFVEEYRDYVKSNLYAEMTGREQNLIDSYYSAEISDPDRKGLWVELGGELDGTLFGLREICKRFKTRPIDTLVLTGMGVHKLYEEKPEWFRNWKENGFDGLLDAAAFAGAVINEEVINFNLRIIDESASFEVESLSSHRKTSINISGSIHGDFVMYAQDIPQGDIHDISGRRTLFAPAGEVTAVVAYHSVEMNLMQSIFMHMDRVLTVQEQKEVMLATRVRLEEQLSKPKPMSVYGGGNFADYGDEDIALEVGKLKYWHETGHSSLLGDGRVYHMDIVTPGNNVTAFEVGAGENGSFRLTNTIKHSSGEKTVERQVDIPVENMSDMMSALVAQAAAGRGRTSPVVLLELIYEHTKHLESVLE